MFDVAGRRGLRVFGEFGLILAPRHRFLAGIFLHHRDAAIDRADEHAEIAADALRLVDDGNAAAVRGGEIDALMRAIPRRDVAKLAADAEFRIDLGDDPVIQVEVAPVFNVG